MTGGRIGAKETGDASAQGGAALSNTGVITGPVTLSSSSRRPAVSGYLLQVERMAAADFRGRGAELSELASFSTEEPSRAVAGKNYWRWLAPAWAGKSALLAEFVLNPPPGIDVVAFFITSRMAGQNDAAAFCEVVQRQLYALLREEEPLSTPATRDEQLRLAMDRAAEHCAAEGRRLVLVVDGLDEDHGVTAGPDCHSIAALLPRTPPHGMRIIVAGRPHPPVPDDVPGDHPLRTTEINHWLAPSPHAQVVRWDAEQNLLRLLEGGGLGRELVGLTVAAGGGLSASDIAELTGSRTRLVERELSAVTGRSFRRRSVHWASDGPAVYLLAHEEIQRSAADLITDAELADCRTRLHTWARTYRSAGWPATTPEYLLRGYARLLRELGSTGQLVELVCDTARHERLWQVTGADLEALGELSASLDQLLGQGRQSGDLDVSAALRLAAARDGLHERTAVLPADLIGLWARLGHTGRAISLAQSQRDSYNRVSALTTVATCLAATGHRERADALAADADNPEDEALLLEAVAKGLAEAGLYGEAFRTVARMEGTDRPAKALVATVRRAADDHAAHGRVGAETITPHLTEAVQAVATVRGVEQGELYADLACAFSLFGDEGRAQETVDLAVRNRSDDEGTFRQAQNLGHIAVRLAPAPGLARRAASIARDAAGLAETIDDPRSVEWLFPQVAAGLAATGQYERAEQVAGILSDPADRDEGLCAAARAAAHAGDPSWALEVADRLTDPIDVARILVAVGRRTAPPAAPAEISRLARRLLTLTDAVSDQAWQAGFRTDASDFLLRAGEREQAEAVAATATALARNGTTPRGDVTAQIAVARALAAAGAGWEAHRLVDRAAESAEAESGYLRLLRLVDVARGLHAIGQDDHKVAVLSALLEETRQQAHHLEHADSLQRVAEAFGETGRPDLAREVARELLDRAETLDSAYQQGWHRYCAAGACLAAGDFDKALALVSSLPDDVLDDFRSGVVEKLVRAGEHAEAGRLAEELTGTVEGDRSLMHIAAGMAAGGDFPGAVALLDEIPGPGLRDRAMEKIVSASVRAGATHEAHALADAITDPGDRSKALAAVARAHGPTPRGRVLLVEALALGPWDQVVEAIAGVAPEHLLLLADLSRNEHQVPSGGSCDLLTDGPLAWS
ncbi:hypothetical protein [Streptomyces sindenensis]|uniref:hypothetical protein n=1 Tax=Streptomyces sindenensis TaxID=67363 RepID=UPI0016724864|nr:hypothetical protein [Streptomyces sindenensis]GGP51730.1 hypothetical protein GCM10010231_23680 [Streptomyces sindenensis]